MRPAVPPKTGGKTVLSGECLVLSEDALSAVIARSAATRQSRLFGQRTALSRQLSDKQKSKRRPDLKTDTVEAATAGA